MQAPGHTSKPRCLSVLCLRVTHAKPADLSRAADLHTKRTDREERQRGRVGRWTPLVTPRDGVFVLSYHRCSMLRQQIAVPRGINELLSAVFVRSVDSRACQPQVSQLHLTYPFLISSTWLISMCSDSNMSLNELLVAS